MPLSGKTLFRFIGLIIILAVIFVGYRFFFLGGSERERVGLELVTPAGGQTDEFLNILLSLQQIDLKPDIFQTDFFHGLVDFSPRLIPQTPGRANPFAPIGQGGRPTHDLLDSGIGTSTAISTGP